MRRALALVAMAAAVNGLGARDQDPPQTFRSTTDTVFVDVSVREKGAPVTGLTAEDFVLLDNGVRQRVESVEATTVPIDLTLIIDESGNIQRTWDAPGDPLKAATAVDSEIRQVASILREGDRLQVLAIDQYVEQPLSWTSATHLPAIHYVSTDGLASLYDSVIAALVQPVDANRRHVIVARTKGVDTISVTEAYAVRAVARNSDALLHLVMMERAADDEAERYRLQCGTMGLCWPTRRFWTPLVQASLRPRDSRDTVLAPVPELNDHFLTPMGQLLVDAADATGGALHRTSGVTEPTLTGAFKQAFDNFRRAYVLRYTPTNVARVAWHAIQVRVPGHSSYVVHARSGYAIEPPPAASVPAVAAPISTPKTLDDFMTAYEKLQFDAVIKGLRESADTVKLIRDFRTSGNPWPASPNREAAFALDLAETGLFSRREDARTAAKDLLLTFASLVRRPLEADAFERLWLWAVVSVAEGAIHPANAQPLVTIARTRFPGEPRFVLADAILTDQLWPLRPLPNSDFQTSSSAPSTDHITEVVKRYDAAVAFAETAGEATVRLGWFFHRLGREEDALARLDSAKSRPLDPQMQYLRLLFRGHTLSALNRLSEAIDAYREALTILPDTPSGNIALMNARLRSDDKAAAEALAEHVQTAAASALDPWVTYWQGDYRFYSRAIAALRQAGR